MDTKTTDVAPLASFLGDVEQAAMRFIPRDHEALRLLVKYSGFLRENPALMTPKLRPVIATHLRDLIAMATGAPCDGAAIVTGFAVRPARSKAIKADILDNLGDLELAVSTVARRQRVTRRYIHMLFKP